LGVRRVFGLPLGWIVAGVDIALIVHAARTGRFTPWGFVILFLPGIGALAYVVVELVPELLGSTNARRAGSSLVAALDPASSPGRRATSRASCSAAREPNSASASRRWR
jgi:hypothetical protein